MKACEIAGCTRRPVGTSPWCKLHETRLARGWTLEETASRPVRKRGLSAKKKALRAAINALRTRGLEEAARVVSELAGHEP
jgi:hypothetical protein